MIIASFYDQTHFLFYTIEVYFEIVVSASSFCSLHNSSHDAHGKVHTKIKASLKNEMIV